MSTASTYDVQKQYYIIDASGNFFRQNGEGQLVAARTREEAFTFFGSEVMEKLGSGKKAQFYRAVPVDQYGMNGIDNGMDGKIGINPDKIISPDEDNGKSSGQPLSSSQDRKIIVSAAKETSKGNGQEDMNNSKKINPLFQNIADLAEVDWIELMQNLTYVIAMLPAYKEQLQTDQMMADQMIIDLMHFVELYEYDDRNALDIMEKIHEARKERRIVKNELYRVERFQNAVGSNTIAIRCKDALKQIQSKEAGCYRPRIAPELFEEKELAPRNLHKCYADKNALVYGSKEELEYEQRCDEYEDGCAEEAIEGVNTVQMIQDRYTENREDQNMEQQYLIERVGTIYDERQTDWTLFVRSQTEFFRNAQQHIIDLQCDLENIDAAIEEALLKIEDANYNVTQGYRAFKELKDLRNERKETLAELRAVQTIADRFDCDAMLEVYEEIEAEITADEDTAPFARSEEAADQKVVADENDNASGHDTKADIQTTCSEECIDTDGLAAGAEMIRIAK